MPEEKSTGGLSSSVSSSNLRPIILAIIAAFLYALPAIILIFERRAEWCWVSREILLPPRDEIESVTAWIRADNIVFYQDIPETTLPHDVGIRIVEYMRPIMTTRWDQSTRTMNSVYSPLKIRIKTYQNTVQDIDVYVNIGQGRMLCKANDEECERGGDRYVIGWLDKDLQTRTGEFDEGLILRGIVHDLYLSNIDRKNRSDEIELCLLELDAASGRRPLEELDRVRREFYDRQNK